MELCIIGAGPRGLSVLERLCANARDRDPTQHVRVHVIDPHILGGSNVWRTSQSTELLMNTVASQITMFADDSVDCAGPVVAGPSLHDWARFVHTFAGKVPEWVEKEAKRLGPDSYPSRAFYGHYLQWVLRHLLKTTADHLSIELHALTATSLTDASDGTQTVTLSDGSVLESLDAVVLTQGHLPGIPTETESSLSDYAARQGLDYVPPINPADLDLGFLEPGQPTILRGLGLNFFDYMALLTVGRGGEFSRDGNGKLVYHASGAEPKIITGSRRGIPYHARGENQKGPYGRHDALFLTADVVAGFRQRASRGQRANFRTEVWPLIDREIRAVYYSTLLTERHCGCDAESFLRRYRALEIEDAGDANRFDPFTRIESAAEEALLERSGIAPEERWDWHAISKPYGETKFADAQEYRDWLIPYLSNDVVEAKRGNVSSPLKAALDVMRDLRNEIRLIVDHSGLSGDSYRDDLLGWYTPFNAFVSIGPPARRIEELVALIEADIIEMVGPGMIVETPDDGLGFQVGSSEIPEQVLRATALIEARLPEPDLRRTTDPLMGSLLARGEARVYRIPSNAGGHYQTGGLAVSNRPYNLVGASRQPHPRRFAFGVPTEAVHWVTAAGIRPGVNSVIVADADAVARASLSAASLRFSSAAGL